MTKTQPVLITLVRAGWIENRGCKSVPAAYPGCVIWALRHLLLSLAIGTALPVIIARASSAQCCGDCDGDGRVTIAELVAAVSHALNGCSEASATPTPEVGAQHQLTAGGLFIAEIESYSPSEPVTDTTAVIDLCQEICAISGDVSSPTVELEAFRPVGFTARLSYRGKGIATVETYSTPLPHGDRKVTSVNWRAPGGTCDKDIFRECANDGDCGNAGPCEYTKVPVDVLLCDFVLKELLRGDQQCQRLGQDEQGNLVIIPGNFMHGKVDLTVTFNGNDPADGPFSVALHFAATLEDINTCQ